MRFAAGQVVTVGDCHEFEVQVYLDELDPTTVRVELYADARPGEPSVRQRMMWDRQRLGALNDYVYRARMPASRSASDYTPRILPSHPDATVPLEAPQIRWQR